MRYPDFEWFKNKLKGELTDRHLSVDLYYNYFIKEIEAKDLPKSIRDQKGRVACQCDKHYLDLKKDRIAEMDRHYYRLECAFRQQTIFLSRRYRDIRVAKDHTEKRASSLYRKNDKLTNKLYNLELRLSRETRGLKSFMAKYCGHNDNCRTIQLVGRVTSKDRCTCGYTKNLLKVFPQGTKGTEAVIESTEQMAP